MNKDNILNKTFNLAFQSHQKNNLQIAEKLYKEILEINPDNAVVNNNLGIIIKEREGNKKAISFFKKAIEIQPNYADAYNNLGNIYRELENNEKAINFYKKAIQINHSFNSARYNLGTIFKKLKKYQEAINLFQKINSTNSRAQLLECTYFIKDLNHYKKKLKELINHDPFNMRIAAMAAYVSKIENIKNIYPFCKNPLNFVFIKNIKNKLKTNDEFSKNLLGLLRKMESVWEPSSTTTKKGYQTLGNLFDENDNEVSKLKEEIKRQIVTYRKNFKSCKDHFIKKWPHENDLHAWHVKLLKQGYQKAHIHPARWLSGVFYLKVPKVLKKNEGCIKFQFYGYDYPEIENLPNLIYAPKIFDLVLFPSSLFHRTIPFESEDERHSIAFDLVPK